MGKPKRAGRELAYVLTLPLTAAAGLVYLLIVAMGVLSSASGIGLPLLALCVPGARGLGAANRRLAGLAGVRVAKPAPLRLPAGLFNRLGTALGDAAGWRAIIHSLVRVPAAVLAFAAAAGLWGFGVILLACPLWWQAALFPALTPGGWPGALLASVIGLVLLLAAPAGVHLALGPERMLARTLLGPAPAAARIRTLEETRALAVDDAAAALRRVERDLHDGTAARLVTLAMSLDMVREELAEAGPSPRLDRARALLEGAHHTAKETLAELTDLIRGIHPAALDNGLEIALTTLAARSPLTVALDADLPERPSPAVETIAFFCTAELLANVAKHSGARRAEVELRARDGRLRLRVSDDGAGGAAISPHTDTPTGTGTGLRGLADRVRVVDGTLGLHSPPGGPTVVTVDLPLRA
ncbi:sensor domain-containing protein [Nonomuraea sp. NPDC046802]|uniref:sensor histidine kinase n=1 Tax=Nonomuraea sp. NPDC046802 TaxID=3154919 RepID=UPI0033F29CF2